MIEIGIVGAKNSGKTTLIEALVPQLIMAGVRVATIKHTSHGHSFDTEGKDTYRHRQAGAGVTLAVSDTNTATFSGRSDYWLSRTLELMADRYDICLVEGDRDSERLKVLVTRGSHLWQNKVPDQIVATYGSDRTKHRAPHFDPHQISELAEYITRLVERRQGVEPDAG